MTMVGCFHSYSSSSSYSYSNVGVDGCEPNFEYEYEEEYEYDCNWQRAPQPGDDTASCVGLKRESASSLILLSLRDPDNKLSGPPC